MSRRPAVRSAVSVALSAVLVLVGALAARAAPIGPPAAQLPPNGPVEPQGPTQVVVYDRMAGTSTVVSHDQAGRPGDGSSSRASISGDGSAVAFESDVPMVVEDTNGMADVYLWSRESDRVERISLGLEGVEADGASGDPSISGDGAVVAFASLATNLTPDVALDGTTSQVFAWQRGAGASTLASAGLAGAGSASSGAPSVSLDGRVVAFESLAPDLVADDTNGTADVFLRDLVRGSTIRASVASNGEEVAAESRRPSLSADGGGVAFDSTSAALTPGDANEVRDVFVRDLPPAVQVAPNPLDFGVAPLGTAATQSVTVVSVGWTPVTMSSSTVSGTNAGDFSVADDACTGRVLAYGTSCAVAVLHVPTAAGVRTATLSIADSALDSPQLVSLAAGVPAPQVRLDPAVGPPGIVTVLSGSQFPPGARVTVTWDPGITQQIDPIVVGADGAFSVGVLVFHNDRTGPRQLLVAAAGGGPPFDDETAPFLVVPAAVQPPGSSAVTFASPDLRLILNRR